MELIRKPRLLAVNNIALLAPLRSVQCACTCRVVSCAHARTYTSLIHHTNPLFSTHAHAHAHAPHYDIEVDTQWMTVCAGVFRSHCDLLSSFCLTFYLLFLFYFYICVYFFGGPFFFSAVIRFTYSCTHLRVCVPHDSRLRTRRLYDGAILCMAA